MLNKQIKTFTVIFILGTVLTFFYIAYKDQMPKDNYVAILVCGFGCGYQLLFNLNTNQLSLYEGKYNLANKVYQRELKAEELVLIISIFKSEAYLKLPEFNNKIAIDAEQISIQSRIQGHKKSISHIMPDNEKVRRIIDMYHGYVKEI